MPSGDLPDPTLADLYAVFESADKSIAEGKLSQAADVLEENRHRFESRKGSLVHIKFLMKTAEIFSMRSRWHEAFAIYESCSRHIEKSRDEGPEWTLLAQEAWFGMGKIEFRRSGYDKAEEFFKKCLEAAPGDNLYSGRAHIELGGVWGERGDPSTALPHFLKAISILEPFGESYELSRAYNNCADAYNKAAKYDKALEFADKSVKLAKALSNPRMAGYGYMNGGWALIHMPDPLRAKDYLAGAWENLSGTDEIYVQGTLHTLKGMVERDLGNHAGSKASFEKAIEYLQEAEILYYLARAYTQYGILLERMGEPEKARELLTMALNILSANKCGLECARVNEHLVALGPRPQ